MRPPDPPPEQDRPESEYRVPIDIRSLLVVVGLCGAIPLALWAIDDTVRVVGLVGVAVLSVGISRHLRRFRWVPKHCVRIHVPGTDLAVVVAVTQETR